MGTHSRSFISMHAPVLAGVTLAALLTVACGAAVTPGGGAPTETATPVVLQPLTPAAPAPQPSVQTSGSPTSRATDGPTPTVAPVPPGSSRGGGGGGGSGRFQTVQTPDREADQTIRFKVNAKDPWHARPLTLGGGIIRVSAEGKWTVTGSQMFTQDTLPMIGPEGYDNAQGERILDDAPWGALLMKSVVEGTNDSIQLIKPGQPYRIFRNGNVYFGINDTFNACKVLGSPNRFASCHDDNLGELTLTVEYWAGTGPGGPGPAADAPPTRPSRGRSP